MKSRSSDEAETNRPGKYCWKGLLESLGDQVFVNHLEQEISWAMAWANGP